MRLALSHCFLQVNRRFTESKIMNRAVRRKQEKEKEFVETAKKAKTNQ